MKYLFFILGLALVAFYVQLGDECLAITTAILYGSMVIAEAIRAKKMEEKE